MACPSNLAAVVRWRLCFILGERSLGDLFPKAFWKELG